MNSIALFGLTQQSRSVVRMQRETLNDMLWREAMPLLTEHWMEIAHYPDIPLDPDRAAYASAEAAGMLRCYTARRGATLVGYAVFLVRPNLHYRSSTQASQDVIYVDPSARGGTGYRFIKWCDEQLAAEGIQAAYHHIKAKHNFGPMLERMGYELVDLIYAKRLD
jgi:hypothetical protein